MNQENIENIEKEIIENEATQEQKQQIEEFPVEEMTNEEKLEENLAKEKDKFLVPVIGLPPASTNTPWYDIILGTSCA